MKSLSLLFTLIITACYHPVKNVEGNDVLDKPIIVELKSDSVINYPYINNFSDRNIVNNSDRQIDLLYNSINHYLGGQRNYQVTFHTECLPCEPIQVFEGGLLFAKQLLITSDQIKYYKKEFDIADTLNNISSLSDNGERRNPKFKFSDGSGHIKYTGVSCNDADYNKVKLKYPSGEIVVDSIINATFFEYDLNTDGTKEQYLLGARSCNQEFVLLRIRRPEDGK